MPEDLKDLLLKVDEKFWWGEDELRNGVRTEGKAKCAMFRVPAQLRELSEQSYNPKFFGFGLYGHDKEDISFTLAYRHDFAKVFMIICESAWSDRCRQVVGGTVEVTRIIELVNLYDDFKLEDFKYDEFKSFLDQVSPQGLSVAAEGSGDHDAQLVTLGKICLTLTMDAVFVVCFHIANHQRRCKKCLEERRQNMDLNEVVEREALCNLLHLVRQDIMKFENQIPLLLIEEVVKMLPENFFHGPRRTRAPKPDGETRFGNCFCCCQSGEEVEIKINMPPSIGGPLPRKHAEQQVSNPKDGFNEIVRDYIRSIYCNLPGFADKAEFDRTLESMKFNECRHLLHCLYLVITYKSKKREEGNAGVRGNAAAQGHATPETPLWKLVLSFLGSACSSPIKGPEHLSKGKGKSIDLTERNTPKVADPGEHGSTTQLTASISQDRGDEQALLPEAQRSTSPTHLTSSSATQRAPPWWPPSGEIQGPERSEVQSVHDEESSATKRAPPWWPPSGEIQGPERSEVQSVHDEERNNGEGANAVQSVHKEERNNGKGASGPAQGLTSAPVKSSDHHHSVPASWWCSFKKSSKHNHKYQLPTVSQLRGAGIRVQVGHSNSTNWISEVKFENWRRGCRAKGILYLPAFEAYDETESLLRNLVTYEYVVEKKADLLSYVHLMGNLINTEEDVQFMMDSGVLKNNTTGSNKHFAEMWATMLTGIAFTLSPSYLKVFDKTWKHYDTTWNKVVEEFSARYFRRFWLLGGLILLGITLAATILGVVYTLKRYY